MVINAKEKMDWATSYYNISYGPSQSYGPPQIKLKFYNPLNYYSYKVYDISRVSKVLFRNNFIHFK